ncbi:phosphatase PAP2 family protein [Glycomyces sp. L485]|uniref:phosphatase PAP2 family protein n=1 Tax=Glycomyces sp. L485 TaxID=2909235 RepID=UPI001F4B51D6|nr:phosphatase PAP2 family protein [Glycomyces sp. L485]MCH7230225.1 phosphatase PAP2 family protein [Glycomyces sp. L485]
MTPRAFPTSRLALPLALVLPLAVLAIALWVRADPASPPFQGLDDAWLRLMNGGRDQPLWFVADAFDNSGGRIGVLSALLLASILVAWRRWRSAVFALAAVSATHLAIALIKLVGDRDRPTGIMVDASSNAFPSGHSARMASVVVVLTVVAIPVAAGRWWWPLAAALVLAMMWSRTWQHAHWLSDTICGAATGIGVSMLCWRACGPLLERERAEILARTRDDPSEPEALPLAGPPPDRPRCT